MASAVCDTDSSTDSDGLVEENELDNGLCRPKREIAWCGVPDEDPIPKPEIVWPPPPESVGNSSWRTGLRNVNFSGPKFGNRMQLFSKTGFNLAVTYDRVYGTQDDNDEHGYLELVNAGRPGAVRIYGMLTNLYIAMDKKGRLYPERNMQEENTIFQEETVGPYNTYLSFKHAHKGWFLGLKKSGKFKNGKKTAFKQKACLFLPRRGKFE